MRVQSHANQDIIRLTDEINRHFARPPTFCVTEPFHTLILYMMIL